MDGKIVGDFGGQGSAMVYEDHAYGESAQRDAEWEKMQKDAKNTSATPEASMILSGLPAKAHSGDLSPQDLEALRKSQCALTGEPHVPKSEWGDAKKAESVEGDTDMAAAQRHTDHLFPGVSDILVDYGKAFGMPAGVHVTEEGTFDDKGNSLVRGSDPYHEWIDFRDYTKTKRGGPKHTNPKSVGRKAWFHGHAGYEEN